MFFVERTWLIQRRVGVIVVVVVVVVATIGGIAVVGRVPPHSSTITITTIVRRIDDITGTFECNR